MKAKQIINKDIVDKLYDEGYRYSNYGQYQRKIHGKKICKVPLNAHFTCPNWDGRLADTGCAFCPNFARQFTYESFRSVMNKGFKRQIAHQVEHYQSMGAGEKALVYIAFGTNTYAPLKKLKKIYDEALAHPDVIGLSVGTRPDCLPDEVLDLLGEYVQSGYEMWIEVGQQTPHFHTLESVNRRHGFSEAIRVVGESHERDIKTIFFNILGMPGETPAEMIETARLYSALGVDAVKLYPLIVMKDTQLALDYKTGKYKSIGFMEYINLICDFVEHLSPYVLIQRFSKDCGLETKLAPTWNTYRLIVRPTVEKILEERGTKQGSKFNLGLNVEELAPYKKKS